MRRYDSATGLLMLSMPGSPREKALDPRTVRKNDTSAKSMHEWMGVLTVDIEEVPSMSIPSSVSSLGNYAAQVQWEDGFNQVPMQLLHVPGPLDKAGQKCGHACPGHGHAVCAHAGAAAAVYVGLVSLAL